MPVSILARFCDLVGGLVIATPRIVPRVVTIAPPIVNMLLDSGRLGVYLMFHPIFLISGSL